MTDRDDDGGTGPVAKSEREQRLAEALRANLRRRKAQARSRRAGAADGREGLAAAHVAGDTEDGAVKAPESAGESADGSAA